VATPPGSSALVITTLHIDTYDDPSPGPGDLVEFIVETGTACSGSQIGVFFQVVNPATVGNTDVQLAPGLGVPAGDALCASENASLDVQVAVSGYTVPSAAVPAAASHALGTLPQQQH
jgi:hypothetical protein